MLLTQGVRIVTASTLINCKQGAHRVAYRDCSRASINYVSSERSANKYLRFSRFATRYAAIQRLPHDNRRTEQLGKDNTSLPPSLRE